MFWKTKVPTIDTEVLNRLENKLDRLLALWEPNSEQPEVTHNLAIHETNPTELKRNPAGSVKNAVLKVLEDGELWHNIQLAEAINKTGNLPYPVAHASISAACNILYGQNRIERISAGMWRGIPEKENAA